MYIIANIKGINQTGGESGSPTRDCNKIPINHSILDTVFQELNDSDLFVGISVSLFIIIIIFKFNKTRHEKALQSSFM